MSLTTDPSIEKKRENLRITKAFHQRSFEKEGVEDAYFLPKVDYPASELNGEICIGVFNTEIKASTDIYIEFCNSDNTPKYPQERVLYKWRYNAHFDEEYQRTEANAKGNFRYLIPTGELVMVKNYSKNEVEAPVKIEDPVEIPDPNTDAPLDQMTMRDVAALLLRRPVSRKMWLNDIINNKF